MLSSLTQGLLDLFGFFFSLHPLWQIAAILAVAILYVMAISLRRDKTMRPRRNSHLPWTVALSSLPPDPKARLDVMVTGSIASLSTKKAVFVVDNAPFAVGSKVYFSFDSSHFLGHTFCGQISRLRKDQRSDQYRLTLNILDKPVSLSRAMLKKLMLPIAS